MDYVQIASELLIGYFALLLMTKLLGKNQVSQITAFDFISALVLGELVGNALYDDKIGISKILFAVFLWGLLIYVTEWLTQKFRKTRPVLEGGPSIVINRGKIDYDALKKNHLDINQLQHLLRKKDTFSISECEFAILETDGSVSVLKKPDYDYVTKEDLNIKVSSPFLSFTIIMDGEVVSENLSVIGWTEDQLNAELAKKGYTSVNKILYAEWKEQQGLHIQPYSEQKEA